MGSKDSAEVSDVVGLYILKELNKDYKTTNIDNLRKINLEGLEIVKKFDIEDKTAPYNPKPQRINPATCLFGVSSLDFLGHKIDKDGI